MVSEYYYVVQRKKDDFCHIRDMHLYNTEQNGLIGNVLESYWKGVGFESRTGHILKRLNIFIILCTT